MNAQKYFEIYLGKLVQREKPEAPFADDGKVIGILDELERISEDVEREALRRNEGLRAQVKAAVRDELLGQFVQTFPVVMHDEIRERMSRVLGPSP